MDSAALVAIFTGGTAVLAGWVTSLGNTRAAKVQAQAAAQAQHHTEIRASRRTAYLELIEQAHNVGELYWRLGDIYVQESDPDAQLQRIEALRVDLRDAFAPLQHCVRIVVLEGPAPVAQQAEELLAAVKTCNSRLHRIAQGVRGAEGRFQEGHKAYRRRLDSFIGAARAAMEGPSP